MSKKTEIEALIRLLDEEDEMILENVTNKLLSYGEEVVFNLENSWGISTSPLVQERIESIIDQINFNEVYKALKKWSNSNNPDLYNGVEIIAKYQFPDLDSENIKTSISGIKQKIWLEINNDLTPLELVSVFNHIFFGQFGFKSKINEKPDINDFCINYVLEAKKGSAILIGVLYSI
ncbi:MAG: transglutaminase family protein, partial [Chitinophagales bacterium]